MYFIARQVNGKIWVQTITSQCQASPNPKLWHSFTRDQITNLCTNPMEVKQYIAYVRNSAVFFTYRYT